MYILRGFLDEENIDNGQIIPGSWKNEVGSSWKTNPRIGSNYASKHVKLITYIFCQYFLREGAIPRQDRIAYIITSM